MGPLFESPPGPLLTSDMQPLALDIAPTLSPTQSRAFGHVLCENVEQFEMKD